MNPALRPLSIGELLDRSFSIYRMQFVAFITIAAIPALFYLAGRLAIALLLPRIAGDINGGYAFWFNLRGSYLIGWLVFLIVYFILGVTAEGAMISAVSSIYLSGPTSISQSLTAMKGKVFRVVAVNFGKNFLSALALILLIVPGVLLWLRWSVAVPAAVLGSTSVTESLERSASLTEGSRGRIFLIVLLYLAILYSLSISLGFPLGFLRGVLVNRALVAIPLWYTLGILLSTLVVTMMVTPIINIALTLQYYDGRIRKEAFDLQLLIDHASAAAVGAP